MKQTLSKTTWARFFLAGLILTALLACNLVTTRAGEMQTVTDSVALDGATNVKALVEIGAGELTISGGAEDLLEATFAYNIDEWEPDVDYSVRNGEGSLEVRQPDVTTTGISDDVRNAWNLEFNETVPLEMRVRLGLGENELDFSDLTLSSLEVTAGAGDTFINVGTQDADRVSVEAGLGEMTLRIPGGDINDLTVKMGAGAMNIDLRGAWEDDLDAVIGGGLGELTVQLPRDVGVLVRARTGLGSIEARGFDRDGDTYVNDAYGQSDVTLEIDIDAGIGTVRLELGE